MHSIFHEDFTEEDFPEEFRQEQTANTFTSDNSNQLPDPESVEQRKYDSFIEYERYAKRYGTTGRPSQIFIPGEKLPGSLFTVIGPGYTNRFGRPTWQEVKVRCACGTVMNMNPANLRRPQATYSCGCAKKQTKNQKDLTGRQFHSKRAGKTLTVLYRQPTGEWVYVCDCCALTGIVPTGQGLTFESKLKTLAARPCALKDRDRAESD